MTAIYTQTVNRRLKLLFSLILLRPVKLRGELINLCGLILRKFIGNAIDAFQARVSDVFSSFQQNICWFH